MENIKTYPHAVLYFSFIFWYNTLKRDLFYMENKQSKFLSLSSEQKIGFVLLLIFGILTIALGFLQMRNTIYNPFAFHFKSDPNSQVFADEKTRLQQIDTDNDGLNDYDEMEFYKTSPYLPDTDSDGLSDKFEIENSKDPLCPEGTICEVQTTPEENVQTESPLLNQTNPMDLLNQMGQIVGKENQGADGVKSTSTENVDLNSIVNSPALLRQLLLSSGKITEEQLSKIDDAALMDLVKKSLVPSP